MKKFTYLIILLFPLILLGCPNNSECDDYGIWISNNSNQEIAAYIACDLSHTQVYPDTTISLSFRNVNIHPKTSFKYTFTTCARIDPLSIYIFSSDTISKYGWEKVRDEYMIIKRFELSWKDIKEAKWMVNYP